MSSEMAPVSLEQSALMHSVGRFSTSRRPVKRSLLMPQFLRRAPWQWLATFAILLLLASMVAGMPPHSIWGFDTDFPAGTELHGTAALGLLLLAFGIAVPARWQVTRHCQAVPRSRRC